MKNIFFDPEPIGEFCYQCPRYEICNSLPEECGIMDNMKICPHCGNRIIEKEPYESIRHLYV